MNEEGKVEWVNDFYWDGHQTGISENFMLDFRTHVVATKYLSFSFSEEWDAGIWFKYMENEIRFFAWDVLESDDQEDGLLCMIYRSEEELPEQQAYYMGTDTEYYYYVDNKEVYYIDYKMSSDLCSVCR